MCHYCGYIEREPKQCPKCKSKMIGGFGAGTEKVEAEINRLFPEAKTLRMDKDTTGRKGAHAAILNKFKQHKADVLIGTQMVMILTMLLLSELYWQICHFLQMISGRVSEPLTLLHRQPEGQEEGTRTEML